MEIGRTRIIMKKSNTKEKNRDRSLIAAQKALAKAVLYEEGGLQIIAFLATTVWNLKKLMKLLKYQCKKYLL